MAPFKDALRESAALQKELQLKGAEAYFSFIKTVVSLSVVILSLAVSFQKDLSANNPAHLWLLQGALGTLAGSVLCGLVAMFGESRLYTRAAEAPAGRTNLSPCFVFFAAAALVLFAFGVLAFAAFGIVNIAETPTPPPIHHHLRP